ncbi:hypothetical protein [Glycomyces sp. NPDC048151]|uniref:hypothetical protein n=1 Tax=Glycomyces sp. NPDC048151 TaxID=3364002 RepID=UPI00371A0B49
MNDLARPRKKVVRLVLAPAILVVLGTVVALLSGVFPGSLFGLGASGDDEYLEQAEEVLSWTDACNALRVAEFGELAGLPGEPETVVESSPTSYTDFGPTMKCIIEYDAIDCETSEPEINGTSWIEVVVTPWRTGDLALGQYEAVLGGYGDSGDRYDTHFDSLSVPWGEGEVFVSQRLSDIDIRNAAAVAISDFYVVEIGIEAEGKNCTPSMEELANLLTDEYMPMLHDSIESRIS